MSREEKFMSELALALQNDPPQSENPYYGGGSYAEVRKPVSSPQIGGKRADRKKAKLEERFGDGSKELPLTRRQKRKAERSAAIVLSLPTQSPSSEELDLIDKHTVAKVTVPNNGYPDKS